MVNIPGDAFLIVNTWQCYISNVIPGEVRALPLMVRGISILHVAGTFNLYIPQTRHIPWYNQANIHSSAVALLRSIVGHTSSFLGRSVSLTSAYTYAFKLVNDVHSNYRVCRDSMIRGDCLCHPRDQHTDTSTSGHADDM